MSFWSSLSTGVVQAVRWLNEAPTENVKGAPRPPKRHRQAAVTVERALSLSTFYRGVQIHATAACQLSIAEERGGEVLADQSLLIQQPDVDESLSAFIEFTVVSLYTDGNAFWRIFRNPAGAVVNLKPLDPNEVSVDVVYDRHNVPTTTYNYRGKTLTRNDVKHLKLLRVPGLERGLGPIQAAQLEVRGALDARDYGAMWLSDANMPDGILTTEQELGPKDSEKYLNVWYGRNPDGTTKDDAPDQLLGERLRVLGKGLSYAPILLKPSDVQFLETQQFSTVQMARLIGAPASLMLVAVEGNSETYSNVEQEWIGYVRFSLMKPLREIEEALSALLPGKRKARFKVDALLRTDTKTRYEAHALSLDPQRGWATPDEVRALEGQPALTDAQRTELTERRKTTPRKENAND
ncbi:phage portal protein [Microbacterium sp. cx-55]|uniref:phage portal protein n=1 Tax=Microbacterium sp. cx-55 TaxID=2875948 RepID=UPI001CC15C89|nr:phage portal protein [Microbacterium sp. cx-55]MBZ4486275.1 phage portal protein [Microbacterium sp. cx-55]